MSESTNALLSRQFVEDIQQPIDMLVMGCDNALCDFKIMKMQRRPCGEEDVVIKMMFCGICHSDLHTSAGHLKGIKPIIYPCVPGHELAGICTQVGNKVKTIKVGDKVGVGCMVDACLQCRECLAGQEVSLFLL